MLHLILLSIGRFLTRATLGRRGLERRYDFRNSAGGFKELVTWETAAV
jgi:hypothetical protein